MERTREEFEEALAVIKDIIPRQHKLIEDGYWELNCEKENNYILLGKVVRIYSILKKKKELNGRNLQVLVFYLREGYSLGVKKKMARQLNIQENNINQVNSNLRKEGYLISDRNNQRNNVVAPELLKLKERIVDKDKKNLVIRFNED